MERIFGIAAYLMGLVMMLTMILETLGVIDRMTNNILTVVFLVFGYLLCLTGYMFARSAPRFD